MIAVVASQLHGNRDGILILNYIIFIININISKWVAIQDQIISRPTGSHRSRDHRDTHPRHRSDKRHSRSRELSRERDRDRDIRRRPSHRRRSHSRKSSRSRSRSRSRTPLDENNNDNTGNKRDEENEKQEDEEIDTHNIEAAESNALDNTNENDDELQGNQADQQQEEGELGHLASGDDLAELQDDDINVQNA